MRKFVAALWALLLVASIAVETRAADPDSELKQAFSQWGSFLVGGTWSGAEVHGGTHEQRWKWILDKSFLQVSWTITGDSGMTLFGIDPATGKLIWWGFDAEGRVWKGNTTLDNNSWVDEGAAEGKTRSGSWKSSLTKAGPDEMRLDVRENVVDGKVFPPEILVLTRKK
ncbi:MAG: hypothetical protein FJX44_03610 [Alphaproteobacteria bacterium]|nr:hypothetical protein [Alphaproteobacteria bacterium]